MCNGRYALVGLLLCTSQVVMAAGDPDRGKQMSSQCVECHGKGGRSTDPKIPKLSGQRPDYIATATTQFVQGTRHNPAMDEVLATFENRQDLEDIAAYFAAQPPMKGKWNDKALAREGAELISMARCTYCHFVDGKRHSPYEIEPPPPFISGQHKDYLMKAIYDIRDGKRQADAFGVMRQHISQLTSREIEAIAEFLSGL